MRGDRLIQVTKPGRNPDWIDWRSLDAVTAAGWVEVPLPPPPVTDERVAELIESAVPALVDRVVVEIETRTPREDLGERIG